MQETKTERVCNKDSKILSFCS